MPTDDVPEVPRAQANALHADAFVRLRDVDPRVVTPLLVELEDAGVAAYAEPQGEDSAYTRHVDARKLRRDPLRVVLWVDRDRVDIAEAVVSGELPGLLAELEPREPAADDEAFQALVEAFHANHDALVPSWPVDEDVDVRTRDAEEPEEWVSPRRRGERADEDEPAEDDAEHYVPPPPPPVPPAHPVTKYAVAATVFGFLLIVGAQQLLGFRATWGTAAFGVLVFVAGVATLVARMRDAPPVDDGPDDGAVV